MGGAAVAWRCCVEVLRGDLGVGGGCRCVQGGVAHMCSLTARTNTPHTHATATAGVVLLKNTSSARDAGCGKALASATYGVHTQDTGVSVGSCVCVGGRKRRCGWVGGKPHTTWNLR